MKSIILKTRPNSDNPGQKSLGHPEKNTRNIGHLWKMPCVSLLLCLYHTVFVTALPLPPQAMLKVPAMILGVKGPSNQHCSGGGGEMREFVVFLRKCPKAFGQDCMLHTHQ